MVVSDDSAANSTLIAHVHGWTLELVWDKYPEQQSVTINLEAGETYYIEALHKEGGKVITWRLRGSCPVKAKSM